MGVRNDFSQEFLDAIKLDVERTRMREAHAIHSPADPPITPPDMEILRRWRLYMETGRRDYLIDVAKYAMWQWIKDE